MSDSPSHLVADRYRLLELIGRGGMGRVWAARDELLGRDVAVKELLPPRGLSQDELDELRERSLREARAIARLDHRNVVRIYDVFFAEDEPWIVMELIPSRSLYQALVQDGPMPPDEVARIGLALLGALRAAHRAGLLHRDVKPANVLLADDGRVVLTDFGLAALSGDSSMTSTGVVLGSPAYLAPERALDGEIGPASDLWSLGATLYAAVEGKPPYAKSSPVATLAALTTEPPRPPVRAGVLGPVLERLLEKDPTRRADADEAERLLQAASGLPEAPQFDDVLSGATAITPAAAQPTTVLPVIPARRTIRALRGKRGLVIGIAAALVVAAGIVARPILSSAQADDAVTTPGASPSVTTAAPASTTTKPSAHPSKSHKPSKRPSPSASASSAGPIVVPTTATATTDTAIGRQVKSHGAGTCLYAPSSTSDLEMWACNGSDGEKFTFAADETMRVWGKCAQVDGDDNGAHISLATCNGSQAQRFNYNTASDIVNEEAVKCLDVTDSSTANGVVAQLWECAGTDNQKWTY